jgi:dihydropyrimidine dehydrogenase (NAD+) subunit PreA
MANLEVEFLGKTLRNPFVLASAPPTKDYESIKKGYDAGWAGAVTKSISLFPLEDKTPRIRHIFNRGGIRIGAQNYEMGSIYDASQWVEWVTKLAEEYPDRMLYVSLFAGPQKEEWVELSEMFMDSGADGLELNFSCPHADHRGKGSIIGQDPYICSDLTKIVKDTVGDKLKIMPKMTYLVHPNAGLAAKLCIEEGADAIAGINTIAGLCEIDMYTLKPKLNTGGMTTAGGISHDMIRPFGRLIISEIANTIDWEKYPISAMGGVCSSLKTVIEYLALGANHVQVCTHVMNRGYDIVKNMEKGLSAHMEKYNKTLESIRGAALEYITTWDKLDNIKRVAVIDNEKCDVCLRCSRACDYDAIIASIDLVTVGHKCDGCGSCVSMCPENAIELVPKRDESLYDIAKTMHSEPHKCDDIVGNPRKEPRDW